MYRGVDPMKRQQSTQEENDGEIGNEEMREKERVLDGVGMESDLSSTKSTTIYRHLGGRQPAGIT
jgi:hypothetical protein